MEFTNVKQTTKDDVDSLQKLSKNVVTGLVEWFNRNSVWWGTWCDDEKKGRVQECVYRTQKEL